MENKDMMGKMLGDSEMEQAAGGMWDRPDPQLAIGEQVLVPGGYIGRDYNLYYGVITNRYYVESGDVGVWRYTVNVDGSSFDLNEDQISSAEDAYFPRGG